MRASYLLRFDDVSPMMNWAVWDRVEAALTGRGVRPLVSVVPDNRDEKIRFDEPRPDFWDRVRAWQARGWAIGIHGYQHRLVTGSRGLFGWDDRSEFAGLPLGEQERKISQALAIFERQGVTPDAWVAPNHSFDATTVAALRRAGVRVISDGFSLRPFVDPEGTLWVPQQLWWFRPRPFGVWTVCLHHNRWTERRLETFLKDLSAYIERLTDLSTIRQRYASRRPDVWDRWFSRQARRRKATNQGRRLAVAGPRGS